MAESLATLVDKGNLQAKDVCEPVDVVAAALHHKSCRTGPTLSNPTVDNPEVWPDTLEFLPTCLRMACLQTELTH